jgi:hypothetical protein
VIAVITGDPAGKSVAADVKTPEKSSVPNVLKMSKIPIANPKSPIRFTMKAFRPASAADFL